MCCFKCGKFSSSAFFSCIFRDFLLLAAPLCTTARQWHSPRLAETGRVCVYMWMKNYAFSRLINQQTKRKSIKVFTFHGTFFCPFFARRHFFHNWFLIEKCWIKIFHIAKKFWKIKFAGCASIETCKNPRWNESFIKRII